MLNAGRFKPPRQPDPAKIALIGDISCRMEKTCPIRAGRDAEFARDTKHRIDDHSPVLGLIGGIDRAGLHTGGIVALHAIARLKVHRHPIILKSLFYPGPGEPGWNIVLQLAGNDTGLAVHAL